MWPSCRAVNRGDVLESQGKYGILQVTGDISIHIMDHDMSSVHIPDSYNLITCFGILEPSYAAVLVGMEESSKLVNQ